jgi:hypothetical protein
MLADHASAGVPGAFFWLQPTPWGSLSVGAYSLQPDASLVIPHFCRYSLVPAMCRTYLMFADAERAQFR